MKCTITLSDNYEEFEIVTEINNEIIDKLNNFIEEENISSEDLVHLLIEEFIQPKCL